MTRNKLLGLAAVVVLAGFASGCSDSLLQAIQEDVARATAPQEPEIEILRGATGVIDGSSVDYGNQPTGSVTDITFSIRNTGTGNLILETPSVVPSSPADGFSVQSLSGTSVASGASVNLVIRFAPVSGAVFNAAVTIASNALNDNSVEFSVTGTGVLPDTTPPTGTLTIAGGAAYTQSADVTLSLSATDTGGGTVTEMEVRNDTAFTGNWQAYATSLAWTLSGGDGTKNVYVRYRDNSLNISNTTITDTIILDTVNPTVSSRTPASGAVNQSRAVNAVVNFSENMDQTTFTTSTVYLRIKGGATVSTSMTKAATSATLNPVSDLYYGYDYTIVVTSGVKDLSGRAVSNPGSTDFTVERDFWEGGAGNDLPANAYDVTDNNLYGAWTWTDFIVDTQEESDSWSLPVGVHTPLALLEGIDYYTLEVPDADVFYLRIRVLFTSDTTHGTTVDTSGTESLKLYVTHNGASMAGSMTTPPTTDLPYDRNYEFDITDPVTGGPGTYTIMIYENSSNYANRRTYNLRWSYEPGI